VQNRNPALLSYLPIERTDLQRLLELAREDRRAFFEQHRDWAELYPDRLLGTALCQGAALHYVRAEHGINDFDVYSFYAANPARRWYAKRIRSVDFGDPKFGCSEITKPGFRGRRVDLMGRELPVSPGTPLSRALASYLRIPRTATARELRQKGVVILEPEDQLGRVIWPPGRS
jgi:hypothetical protein